MEPPFKRITIIGLGLIGGSMAQGWRRAGIAARITGWDSDRAAINRALQDGILDSVAESPVEAARGTDVIMLAAPVGAIIDLAPVLGPNVEPGTLVTDAGSSKAEVVRAWEAHLAGGAWFVGGHPMAGSERSGLQWADGDLFRGARYLLTPGRRAGDQALRKTILLAEALGCQVTVLSPEEHDRKVALVSHLPQLAAVALCTVLDGQPGGRDALQLAGGGFRDTTRIAASSPELWGDILMSNRQAILEAVQGLLDELSAIKDALGRGNRAALVQFFSRARDIRSGLGREGNVAPEGSAFEE